VLAASDVVLTTYNTLAVDYAKKSSPLHKIFWYRVVLDEGNNTLSWICFWPWQHD